MDFSANVVEKGKLNGNCLKVFFWFNAFSSASLFCFAFRLSIKGWKIEQKNRKVFEKLSTPDSTPQFSSSAEWKVHLNSIFFVNALLIRHSTIFIPLRLNTCGLPSHWRHKNVIKFQLIFKYVPLRNCFPFRIAFQRVMPLDERFSREKAQARSGKSDAAAKMSLKSFFPPSFDSVLCQFQSIRVFHLFESRVVQIKSKSVKGSVSGFRGNCWKRPRLDRQVQFDSECHFAISLRRKKDSNGETINGSVKSILSFNAVANLHNQLQQKKATVVTMEKSSLRWKKCNREFFPEEIEKYTNSSSSNVAAIITESIITPSL